MAKRRTKGDGSITQRHDHPTCPPLEVVGRHPETGKPIKERPDHACKGRFVATIDLGYAGKKRQRKTMYGRTQKEAKIKLDTARHEARTGAVVVSSMTMEAWLTYWIDVICVERGLKTTTLRSHRGVVKNYLIPNLGRHRVDRLAPEHVRAMYAAMRQAGLAEATLRQTHAILHRALKVAMREGKASRNVAELIDPPKTIRNKRQGLTLEQARRVLAIAPLRAWVALYLGLRQGEALGLRWSDVNIEEGVLFIEQTLVRKTGVGLIFDTPKSQASRRAVPIPPIVLARFKLAWIVHHNAGGSATDLVFNQNGKPIDPRRDWQAWRDLLTRATVPPFAPIPLVALHAARNTAASLLEAAGVPARMAAEILGHANVEVTYGYQQADLERRREAMLALESYIDM